MSSLEAVYMSVDDHLIVESTNAVLKRCAMEAHLYALYVREKGKGLRIKPKPKSKSGWRTLELPSWAVAMLKARRPKGAAPDNPVFPAPLGGLRDPSDTNHDLRVVFDDTGFEWVTSHAYRRPWRP